MKIFIVEMDQVDELKPSAELALHLYSMSQSICPGLSCSSAESGGKPQAPADAEKLVSGNINKGTMAARRSVVYLLLAFSSFPVKGGEAPFI